VSVCLWDCIWNRGGINHYMLPFWNGEGLASPKYGNIAIAKLIEKMQDLGSDRRNLRAKVFGGGIVLNVTNPFMNIGERNVQLAEDMLRSENIPVLGADTGGKVGRKLIYNTETGIVLVKKLTKQIDDIRF
jgi:chemotaxis protein CheD